MIHVEERLPLAAKLRLAWRVWRWFFIVQLRLRLQQPLPRLVEELRLVRSPNALSIPPLRLGRTVHKMLSVGRIRPRCLLASLVFLRLLSEQGTRAVLVVGLPREAMNQDAHAWIEVDGVEVGPPPGSFGHTELVRFEPPSH